MNKLLYTLMLIMLCVGIAPVHGAEVTLSWDATTTYEGGRAMPAGELANYTVHCGEVSGVYTMTFDVPPTDTTAVIDCSPLVDPFYSVSAITVQGARSSNNEEVQCGVPQSPTGLRCGL